MVPTQLLGTGSLLSTRSKPRLRPHRPQTSFCLRGKTVEELIKELRLGVKR